MREVARIESPGKKAARALTDEERIGWFDQLRRDPRAVRKDVPDLSNFMLDTGARIGETLAVCGSRSTGPYEPARSSSA